MKWLRSPNPNNSNNVYNVNNDGNIDYDGVDFTKYVVRPAMWIKL